MIESLDLDIEARRLGFQSSLPDLERFLGFHFIVCVMRLIILPTQD